MEDWMEAEEFLQYEFVDQVQFLNESQGDVEIHHTHKMVDTKLSQHKKNSNGSCVVTIYNAKKCSTCGYYQLGTVYSKTEYQKCSH